MSEVSDREIQEEDYPTNEHVHEAANYKWQNRGGGQGDSLSDWVSEHKEITQAGR